MGYEVRDQITRDVLGTSPRLCQGCGMVLAIVWVLAVTALLALIIAWGATIDKASDSYARSFGPPRQVVSSISR